VGSFLITKNIYAIFNDAKDNEEEKIEGNSRKQQGSRMLGRLGR
jgi:hypothetical protein